MVARWQNCPQLRTSGLQQSYSMKSPENVLKSRWRRVEVTYTDTCQVCPSGNRTWCPEECLLINAAECSEVNLLSVLEWTTLQMQFPQFKSRSNTNYREWLWVWNNYVKHFGNYEMAHKYKIIIINKITVVHWRREWQTTSVFLSWESHEQYEMAKRYDTERWTLQIGRCPICYWTSMEK